MALSKLEFTYVLIISTGPANPMVLCRPEIMSCAMNILVFVEALRPQLLTLTRSDGSSLHPAVVDPNEPLRIQVLHAPRRSLNPVFCEIHCKN